MTTSLRRPAHLGALMLVGAIGGCTVGPDYRPPETAISENWLAPVGAGEVDAAWWTAFGDPLLTELVEAALAGNKDLEVAEARLREADEEVRSAHIHRDKAREEADSATAAVELAEDAVRNYAS